jgi:hypothetical protein
MKTNTIVIEKKVEKAKLGLLLDVNKSISPIPLSQLVPYLGSAEDIEIIMNDPKCLYKNQMIEINGYAVKQILDKAIKVESSILESDHKYVNILKDHQAMIAFPPEVIWLGNNSKALDELEKNLLHGLQTVNIKLDKAQAEVTAKEIRERIERSQQKYEFWKELEDRVKSNNLSRTLMNWSIELALSAKIKQMSGITPVIDNNTDSSVTYSNKINSDYVKLLNERASIGLDPIKYYYTVVLNASMFPADDYHKNSNLVQVVRHIREAINTQQYDGIHFTIRSLGDITKNSGRIRTVEKFVSELDAVSSDAGLPLWCSRCGVLGLPMMDLGVEFNSYSLSTNPGDTYVIFARKKADKNAENRKKTTTHGKVLHLETLELLDYKQVCNLPLNLNDVGGMPRKPINGLEDNQNDWRKIHTKPMNIRVMNELNRQWIEYIKNGDPRHGMQYIGGSKSKFNNWGIA